MAKVLEVDVPTKLNGFPVQESKAHENGYVTVMVVRDDTYMPYVVATWWPDLKSGWSWGHYSATADEAADDFREVCGRNEKRSPVN